jgi:hypothetical protein
VLPFNYSYSEQDNYCEVAFHESGSKALPSQIKTGPMNATDCADPAEYRPIFSIPTRLPKNRGPHRFCIRRVKQDGTVDIELTYRCQNGYQCNVKPVEVRTENEDMILELLVTGVLGGGGAPLL